ncbi:hypothetical protein C8R46DRAFT_521735 [Mycena filopes]|nr:hypothetical protein C8R46DRAFT_521735 [Mycena filopes]
MVRIPAGRIPAQSSIPSSDLAAGNRLRNLPELSAPWNPTTLWPALSASSVSNLPPLAGNCTIYIHLELVHAWLSRSGDCPLSITLTDSSDSPCGAQFLEAVILHCARWEHVDLLVPFENLHLIQGEMPLLRDLTIGPNDLPNDDAAGVSVFDRAPRLTNVVLTNDFVPAVIRLPWAQLTPLTGLCLLEHECTEILRHVVQLVEGAFSIFASHEPYRPLPYPLILTRLRDLSLDAGDIGGGHLWKILDNFTLPGLRTLHVYAIAPPALSTFIQRSQCVLEDLRIDNRTMSKEEYREAFGVDET